MNDDNHARGNDVGSAPYWINGFRVDPAGLSIKGKFGSVSLEPKVMQVLVVLSSTPGGVITRKSLIDQIWAVNHGSDESLTRAISILRKYLGDTNGRRTIIETIPRRGYRLIANVTAHPAPSELGTEETPISASSSASDRTLSLRLEELSENSHSSKKDIKSSKRTLIPRRLNLLVVGAILVSLMLIGFRQFTLQNNDVIVSEQIQINAFYLPAEGKAVHSFATSLRSQMASVFLKNSILTSFVPAEGRKLQKFSITGNIDDQGPNLRVTVNLIDEPTQIIIWSKSFDRSKPKMNSFGDEITATSASLMRCILQLRSDTFNAKAEILVLYARFCDSTSHTSMANFLLLTEPIYKAEPDNRDAISLHAYALGRHAEWSEFLSLAEKGALMQKSRDLVERILAKEPNEPFTQYLLASSMPMVGNWADVEDKLLKATSQGRMPDTVYMKYAFHLRLVGRLRDATRVYTDIIATNPVNAENVTDFAWLQLTQGNITQADKYFSLAERYDPNADLLAIRRFQADVFFGSPNAALKRLEQAPIEQWRPSTKYIACVKTFSQAIVDAAPNIKALELACKSAPPYWTIRMLVALGALDRAFILANKLGFRNPGETLVLFYPDMAPFRADPRFWTIAEQSGILDYWRETNKWPDFCDTDALVFDCKALAEDNTPRSL